MREGALDRIKDLPVMPEVAAKVMNLKEGGLEISFKDLEGIIKVDPALTAKILKIANSALYARQKEITSLQMAITLLGFKNIRSLILLVTASSMFPRMKKSAFYPGFWRHSIACAFLSRTLAVRCSRSAAAEEAFIAGLLHDIGQAVLWNDSPDEYVAALESEKQGEALEAIEERMFEVTHRQVGAALLKKWSFPDLYIDTAEEHDSLNVTSPHKALIILVSVADLLAVRIVDGSLSAFKAGLLLQFLPYTCVAAENPEALAAAFAADLARDPLYQEFNGLLGM